MNISAAYVLWKDALHELLGMCYFVPCDMPICDISQIWRISCVPILGFRFYCEMAAMMQLSLYTQIWALPCQVRHNKNTSSSKIFLNLSHICCTVNKELLERFMQDIVHWSTLPCWHACSQESLKTVSLNGPPHRAMCSFIVLTFYTTDRLK